jgi:S1-C subfamily serine protease
VIDRAIAKETEKNVKLGLYYMPVTKTSALVGNLKTEKGALVYSPSGQVSLAMLAGSPAQRAGLRINDIITAVNGQTVESQKSLPELLYQYKQGDQIELTVLRDGQEVKLPVQL